MMILARLLSPRDFGLVAMATAITGFLVYFQDFGLSTAAVQSPSITREQTSMLFWINLSIGIFLTLLCVLTAPLLAAFYHEPRVQALTVVIAAGFLFNGAAAQHRAMLSRKMRIALLAATDLTATVLGIALGISMAALGFGYWSLAVMAVCPPFVSLVSVWSFGRWIPGLPKRGTGIASMIRYGSLLMADNIIIYIGYNMDKILLGRFAGAQALGFYGRAYQLINIPTANLNSAINAVAFPALSRLQGQPERLRSYFLKCYTLFLSLNIPITVACGLFGEDIIRIFLGPKWMDAVPLFRLLAPTMVAMALINPPGLLLAATGRVKESLWIGLVIAPVLILGYAIGLPYGPVGVASGFSAAMLLLATPVILWAIHYTPVSPADVWGAIRPPLYSVFVAAGAALLVSLPASGLHFALLRLLLICGVLFTVYLSMLIFVMGQKELYLKVLAGLGLKLKRSENAGVPREMCV
jgi:PST family polysaccharide transporter